MEKEKELVKDMTAEEFKKKMKELGWDDEMIQKDIEIHEEAKKKGIHIPYEMDLFQPPTGYPSGDGRDTKR